VRKGRVPTANGNGLRNAIVSLADSHGGTRRVITTAFGYYRFDDVLAGEAYVIAVSSKRFRIRAAGYNVIDELTDVDSRPPLKVKIALVPFGAAV
jgi:hypothetical protein